MEPRAFNLLEGCRYLVQNFTHYQTSDEVMYIAIDANVSKLAYGLIIQGCAMEPLFPNGTTIIIEPERKPKD